MNDRRRLRRSAVPALLYSGAMLPTFVGCFLLLFADTRLGGGVVLAVGVALVVLPIAKVDDDTLRYCYGPLVRSVPLVSIDAFELGLFGNVGYCLVGSLDRKPIWSSRQTTGRRRGQWIDLLNDQLRRARGTLPTLDQRLAVGGIQKRKLIGVTSPLSSRRRTLYLFYPDSRAGALPRFGVRVPADFPVVDGEPVEVFGNATTGDVILRVSGTGYEHRPIGRMVGTPARSPRWIGADSLPE